MRRGSTHVEVDGISSARHYMLRLSEHFALYPALIPVASTPAATDSELSSADEPLQQHMDRRAGWNAPRP